MRNESQPGGEVGPQPLGVYLAVPFCKSKCSYCNFASDVFAPGRFREYCALLRREMDLTAAAEGLAGAEVDTVYWGGGTPSLLEPDDLLALARQVREVFRVAPGAEFTVEVAPGTLTGPGLEALLTAGVNRISFGVQSMNDAEVRAVGRLHSRAIVLADVERLQEAGVAAINLDLIAGLPHQTPASWRDSVAAVIATGVPHVSVYMLEVDTDSRLGTELLAGGTRYHAHHVPDDDAIVAMYDEACMRLEAAGIRQYEISNFARPGHESRHNERYWLRQPYLGFGVEAHSMLRGTAGETRWGNPDTLETYLAPLRAGSLPRTAVERVSPQAQLEEALFLGLRRNVGVNLKSLAAEFGPEPVEHVETTLRALREDGLLWTTGEQVHLTARGRLLSNEVFASLID